MDAATLVTLSDGGATTEYQENKYFDHRREDRFLA